MEFLPDYSSRIFSRSQPHNSEAIDLKRCEKCGAYSVEPARCCQLLLPPTPLPTALAPERVEFEGWEHMTGGEG